MTIKEMDKLRKNINIGDNINLVYQKPEIFSRYHIVYHGQKYSNHYFRSSPNTLSEKAKYLDEGYFIMKDEKVIGGVFIKPNFMADLFLVPPFKDYEYILDKLLKYLRTISKNNESIVIGEVLETYVPFYKSRGYEIEEKEFWMIRPTEQLEAIVPDNYESKPVVDEDKDEIADIIIAAYKANPCYKTVDSKNRYVEHVEFVLKDNKENEVLYNSSRVVVHKDTNEIVGVCLHMEFEGFPLIMSLVVRPDHQGKGIGSYLLRHSISYSSTKYTATRLSVIHNNSAVDVYEHMGFIKNKTINDMYLGAG